MGNICGSSKRVVPKLMKASLGLRSGQTISSQSVFNQASLKPKVTDLPPINILEVSEDEIVKWDDPQKHLVQLLRSRNYRISKILTANGQQITAEILEGTKQLIFKRQLYDNFDMASNNISYLYNLNKLGLEGLIQFNTLTISIFEAQQFQIKTDKQVYALDRVIPQFTTLNDQIDQIKEIEQVLLVLECVSETLYQLHKNGFAYRFLRPQSIMVRDFKDKSKKYYLSNPSLQTNPTEQALINFIVVQQKDFYQYDIAMFGILFLYLLDPKLYTFEQLVQIRSKNYEWYQTLDKYKKALQNKYQEDTPQIIVQMIEDFNQYEKSDMMKMISVYEQIKSCRQKGLQTFFKNDSLGAYLQFHKNTRLDYVSPWLYFTKTNQIHIYNLLTNRFHYLKIYRKKESFSIHTDIIYNEVDDKFFFFARNSAPKDKPNENPYLLKVYDECHEKNMISYRREVELFKELKNIKIEDPQLLFVKDKDSETDSTLFIFNHLQVKDELKDMEEYTNSYKLQFSMEQVQNEISFDAKDDQQLLSAIGQDEMINKMVVKVQKGPRNYSVKKVAYHFYDPHNQTIYSIPNFSNIFQNGIRYGYYQLESDKKHFREGILRFACSSDVLFKQFCALNYLYRKVQFCVEVQHGVFLMQAANNIFILDFNFKCFYSLASLTQLQKHKENQINNPYLYLNAYETRNQPFELKCIDSGGRNWCFQEGYLHLVARKEIETVHCIYDIIPNQACLVLLNCISLHSNKDLLTLIPKSIIQIYSSNQKIIDSQKRKSTIKTIRQYNCIECLFQENNEVYFQAETEDKKRYYLHAVQVQSVSEISILFQYFDKKLQSDYLLTPVQYFACTEEKQYFMYYVNEEIISTMENDISRRRLKQDKFQPKELSLLIKILFRGMKDLDDNQLQHGNLTINSLCYTKKGLIKISGWYMTNRPKFESDVDDALKVIYGLVCLKHQSEIDKIDMNEEVWQGYDTLLDFVKQVRKLQNSNTFAQIFQLAMSTCKVLNAQKIDFNNFQSNSQSIMWVQYEKKKNNYIIVTPIQGMKEPRFQKINLVKHNGHPFKISKFCMFTFNFTNTIYFSGAQKEEIKSQLFYEVQFNSDLNQSIQVKRLPDIPYGVLAPTLLYCDNQIYSIGGYEMFENMHKNITDKVYVYQTKQRTWAMVAKLPITLYGSTALYSGEQKKIYVFGGVSNEIDLSPDRLIYLTYDVQLDKWEFNVDLSFKSPFPNSRFTKPMIDIVNGDNIFVSFQKADDQYLIQLFELTKGGISLKFQVKDQQKNKDAKMDFDKKSDLKRFLQDDLSMMIYRESLYVLDEDTHNLHIFRLRDIFHPQLDIVPCQIQEYAAPVRQQSTIEV